MSIEQTLAERGNRYGDFADHAKIAQAIQDDMRIGPGWARLDDVKRQALTVIADKIAHLEVALHFAALLGVDLHASGSEDEVADNEHADQELREMAVVGGGEPRLERLPRREHSVLLDRYRHPVFDLVYPVIDVAAADFRQRLNELQVVFSSRVEPILSSLQYDHRLGLLPQFRGSQVLLEIRELHLEIERQRHVLRE